MFDFRVLTSYGISDGYMMVVMAGWVRRHGNVGK